jgi:hypothetical protein
MRAGKKSHTTLIQASTAGLHRRIDAAHRLTYHGSSAGRKPCAKGAADRLGFGNE